MVLCGRNLERTLRAIRKGTLNGRGPPGVGQQLISIKGPTQTEHIFWFAVAQSESRLIPPAKRRKRSIRKAGMNKKRRIIQMGKTLLSQSCQSGQKEISHASVPIRRCDFTH
jgi:hypothetical protein